MQNELVASQSAHATPPSPQALTSLPRAHELFARQQPAQFAGPHLVTHCRPWQICCDVVQSVHATPPVCPHAVS